MTPPESALAAELANLRGDISGLGRDLGDIKTSCAVLVERSTRTEQDLRDLRAQTEQDMRELRKDMEEEVRKIREGEIKPLKDEVEAAKARRWPLPTIGVLTGVAGAGTGFIALLTR